jgi:hypothetical protein
MIEFVMTEFVMTDGAMTECMTTGLVRSRKDFLFLQKKKQKNSDSLWLWALNPSRSGTNDVPDVLFAKKMALFPAPFDRPRDPSPNPPADHCAHA